MNETAAKVYRKSLPAFIKRAHVTLQGRTLGEDAYIFLMVYTLEAFLRGDIENLYQFRHGPALSTRIGDAADRADPRLDYQTQPPIQEHRGNERRERNIVPRLDRACGMGQFRNRDDGEKGAVLDDLDHLVADHRPCRQQ